jgi:hypothetical protein
MTGCGQLFFTIHVTQPKKFNHTENTDFLPEIPFFVRDVGVVRPLVCCGKFSFHFQSPA